MMTTKPQGRPLSLNPLKFDEAVTDLLKVKPPPKRKRKAKTAKRKPRAKG